MTIDHPLSPWQAVADPLAKNDGASHDGPIRHRGVSRRDFLKTSVRAALTATAAVEALRALSTEGAESKAVVSMARVKNGNITAAVEEAIDLLGGIASVTRGKERILLKPNLVYNDRNCTTKPEVIGALARLMLSAGKEVSIGEGSACHSAVNMRGDICSTRCPDLLDRLQQRMFDDLKYTALARSLGIPLINLHTGPMTTVPVTDGLFWKEIVMHQALMDTDLLCSVPMMKTHVYATVTLALKNLVGLYPGMTYGCYRQWIHVNARTKKSPGIAFEILDMARANKLGLSVIDATTAMEGDGPFTGPTVPMNLIIAGTDPLAADLVAASVMDVGAAEVPTFVWAQKLGMKPSRVEDIEIRGVQIAEVKRRFTRATPASPAEAPTLYPAPALKSDLRDGKLVMTWDETIPKAVFQYDPEGKASVAWTNGIQGGKAILERNSLLQKAGWERITSATPGRYEAPFPESGQSYFRLRKP